MRTSRILACLLLASCKPAATGSALKESVAPDQADAKAPNVQTFGGAKLPENQKAILDTMVEHFAAERGPLQGDSLPAAAAGGAWTRLFHLPDTQAVHAMMLPSGKVLIVNGSSHRNRSDGKIFFRDFDDVSNLAVVDFRPGQESFKKLALPQELLKDVRDQDPESAIDLFCGGHSHMPDGNLLFVGGSRTYDSGNFSFSGNHIAWVFDPAREQFTKVMQTKDGRWYPGVFELGDGRMAVVSGIGDQPVEYGPSPDYALDVSYLVEVYDPFQGTWDATSIKDLPVAAGGASQKFPAFIGGSWDAYPRAALQKDGSLLFTGDGVYPGSRSNKNVFGMSFSKYGQPLKVGLYGFANKRIGPALTTNYPGMAIDPRTNDGDILVVGGQLGMNNLGEAVNSDTEFKRTTSDVLTFAKKGKDLTVAHYPKALGERKTTENAFRNLDASMHSSAVVLPTQQVLVLGGGNYGFRAPIFHPVLLTPDGTPGLGFKAEHVAPNWLPHLYHSTALLLPDARVLLAGGNVHRALATQPEKTDAGGGEVSTDFQLTESSHPYDAPGLNYSLRPRTTLGNETLAEQVLPAEMHFAEIYEPPYLRTGSPRPEIKALPSHKMQYGKSFRFDVTDQAGGAKVTMVKLGAVTHAMDFSQRLVRLDIKRQAGGQLEVAAPASGNVAPPGYYMLFYVSAAGVPSVAKTVCLSRTEATFAKACDHDYNAAH